MNTIIDKIDIWTTAQELKTSNRGRSASNQSLLGIKKLRELILELAVRGKLVSQDPNDEPASVLLKKIEVEKRRLIKEGKNKKQEALPEVGEDEKPFDLPKGWEWTRWNYIALKIGDIDHKMPIEESEGYPYVSPRDFLPNNKIDLFGAKKISEADFLSLSCKIQPQKGDIIYPRYGTIGENRLVETEIDFLASYSCCVIKTMHRFIHPNYQFQFSLSPFVKNQAKQAENKTTQANVGIKSIQNYTVPLPPYVEQHRIVAKVDELMALCDELENQQTNSNIAHETLVATLLGSLTDAGNSISFNESWQRIANNFDTLFTTEHSIDQLKQTILQLAVMGKLVLQIPNDEPASELLKKIAKEKAKLVKEGKIKKQAPLPEIREDEKAFDLPNSWAWVAWGNLLAYDDGAFKRGPFGSSLKKDMFVDSGYKVYEQYCPINDDCSFERYYITNELYENLKTFAVKANDYLISCSGATLGRITQVPEDFKEGIINQALLRVRINHEYLDRAFFKLLFRSPFFQKMILDNSTGSAIPNVKGVNELKSMPIPFLPLAEQHRIVSKVDELFALCDELKERLVEAQTLQNQLAVAVVEQALSTQPKANVSYTINEQISMAAEPE